MMGIPGRLAILGMVGMVVTAHAVLGQVQVVYDNTEHITKDVIYRFSREHGDEIHLAPGYREVSRFTFQYFGDFNILTSPSASFRVRFYMNDGADVIPGPQIAERPKTLLWESAEQPMTTGNSTVGMDVPGIVVPDKFTWTVQFSGVTGEVGNGAGLTLADPPTIGAPLANGRFGSYWDAWIRDDPNKSDAWSLINFGFGPADPKANFYARVEAVRDPFALNIRRVPGGGNELSWSRLVDVLESADTLGGSWSEVAGPRVTISVNLTGSVVLDNRPKGQARFYRLRLGGGPLPSKLAGPAAEGGIHVQGVQGVNHPPATGETGRVDSPKPGTSVTFSPDKVLHFADHGRPGL